MRKLVLILLLALGACEKTNDFRQNVVDGMIEIRVDNASISVYEVQIDGCHYLISKAGQAGSMVHKNNCQNPAHLK